MGSNETGQNAETLSNILTEMFTNERDGEAFLEAFLKSNFLSNAVRALFHARREAGLTQAQLADLLKTKQSAIARLEADTDGSMSLQRYVDFAFECGIAPFVIKFLPLSELHNYVLDNPEAPWTLEAYNAWMVAKEQPSLKIANVAQRVTSTTQIAPTTITIEKQEGKC